MNHSGPVIMVTGYGGPCILKLSGRQTFGRCSGRMFESDQPDLGLFARSISRKHGEFITDSHGTTYRDTGSTNGTYYNGELLKPYEPVLLTDGDVLRIHMKNETASQLDTVLLFTEGIPGKVVQNNREERMLSIRIRKRTVKCGLKRKVLLDRISLDISSGQMALILGGSGAGKTTFMNVVMGYEKADAHIFYNGRDLYRNFKDMKYEIGYVPQQDLMRMEDTVFDTLMNCAKLRLPMKLIGESGCRRAVVETLHMFGLQREAGNLVGKLSGGQRKRLSIAAEYIGNPSLFFLDEPDSGLDGAIARGLMESLRGLADQGKTVLLISHSPDRAYDLFDRVVVLAKGSDNVGHLAFYGTPDQACSFFETSCLDQIIKRINPSDEGGEGLADDYIAKYKMLQH